MALDPGPPGSRTEPKADAQPLSDPGILFFFFFFVKILFIYSREATEREAET